MRRSIAAALVAACLTLAGAVPASACVGDCDTDGYVTVDEIIVGVNIALGTTNVSQCPPVDVDGKGDVTIDELISAVNSALNGCVPQSYAGSYAASVPIDATHAGVLNLVADAAGQVTGSLVVSSATSLIRSFTAAGIAFPPGGVSVVVEGLYQLTSGAFDDVTGSFVDSNGQTVPVRITGSLPGPTGSVPVTVDIGGQPFTSTLSAGTLPTPTIGPGPTPTPTVPASGQPIAYSGLNPDTLNPYDIFVINPDGTGKAALLATAGYDRYPAWSPDGSKVALSTPSGSGVAIGVINANGTGLQIIGGTESPLEGNPAWSPDGTRIVFTVAGGDHIDVMNADGSNRRRLVTGSGEAYGHMSWSPDGTRIAVESTRPRGGASVDDTEIWVFNADGTNFVRLTTNTVGDKHPEWIPNGSGITFVRGGFTGGVYRIKPDGSGETRLFNDPFIAGLAAAWNHAGTRIAYPTLFGIKIVNPDGSNAVTVPGTTSVTDLDLK